MYSIQLDEFQPEPTPSPAPSSSVSQGRKSDRACDFCRRRKTRCDGAPTPGAKCTNCRRNQCPCTYMEASRPRGPPKAYVTALEDRIERFERLFKRLRPDADFTDILGSPVPRGSWRSDRERDANAAGNSSTFQLAQRTPSGGTERTLVAAGSALLPKPALSTMRGEEDEFTDSSDDDDVFLMPSQLKRESPADSPASGSPSVSSREAAGLGESIANRFHGKSSFLPVVSVTRRYMRSITSPQGPLSSAKDDEEGRDGVCELPAGRRQIFWTVAPWEEAWERRSTEPPDATTQPDEQSSSRIYDFPPADLMQPLLSLYFQHTNTIFPLLHGPTFHTHIKAGLHTRCPRFASVVWVCMAIASRWSSDSRVLWDGWGGDGSKGEKEKIKKEGGEEEEWASAGWRFFLRSLDGSSFTVTSLEAPTLYDLQFCSLGAMFLRGSSIGPAGWVVIGTGLRKAMDVGAHRKKVYRSKPNAEDELWKRAFWMLVLFDRIGSTSVGRPCCVREEDFDLDMPLEVDDEYWEPSDRSQVPFRQPEGKPSTLSFFISMLKLTQIQAHALRTIYCIDKSKVLLGLVSEDWQEQIVSQLNTALDDWVTSVPAHIRWSPSIDNEIFSNQSATLYTTYYLCLLLIYRPFSTVSAFLPHPKQDVPTNNPALGITSTSFPFPADSIIATAAQSAIRIVEEQSNKGLSNIPNMLAVAQNAASVRLMGMHSAAIGSSGPQDVKARMKERESALNDVDKCIKCLEMAESRWIMARKFLTGLRASLPDPNEPVVFAPKPTQARVPSQSNALPVRPPTTTINSQSWNNTTPTPTSTGPDIIRAQKVSEAEQALQNHANWRWFNHAEQSAQSHAGYALSHEHSPVHGHAQVLGHGQMMRGGGFNHPPQPPSQHIPLRHHAVVPALRSSASPSPHSHFPPPIIPAVPSHSLSQSPVSGPAVGGIGVYQGRRFSQPLAIPNAPFDIDAQQPGAISSTLRSNSASGGSPASATPPASAGFFGAPQSAAREEYGAHPRMHSGGHAGWTPQGQRVRVPSHPYTTVQAQSQDRPYGSTHY